MFIVTNSRPSIPSKSPDTVKDLANLAHCELVRSLG